MRSLLHKAKTCTNLDDGVELIESAFKSRIASYRVSSPRYHIRYDEFFAELADKIKRLLEKEVAKARAIKINMELFGRFVHQVKQLREIKSFNTSNKIVTESSDINSIYDDCVNSIKTKASEFQERESGNTVIRAGSVAELYSCFFFGYRMGAGEDSICGSKY